MSSCLLSANKQEVFFFTQLVYKVTCSDILKILHRQHAKKVVSNSLVYFAIGLVTSVLT